MSTAELDPISRACRLLREGAAELKNCHTPAATGHDWTGEPEAKAAYDEHMATADALERWADSIGAGGVESLRGRQCLHRISEPAGEYPALPEPDTRWRAQWAGHGVSFHSKDQIIGFANGRARAAVDADRAMRTAQPTGAMLGEQAELRRLSDCCPELNLSNYGPDDVDELNGWAVEVSQCIDRALAAQPAYKDSTPQLHVGDSAFESWYSTYSPAHKADKQRARDAYAAGMGDPLVMAAAPQPASQGDALDAERYRWLRRPHLAAGHGSISVVLDDRANGHMSRTIWLDRLDAAIDAARAAQKGGA